MSNIDETRPLFPKGSRIFFNCLPNFSGVIAGKKGGLIE